MSTWGLSNPDAPAYVASWFERAYSPLTRVELDGRGFAYVSNGDPDWGFNVWVYDVRDLVAPVLVGWIPGGAWSDYAVTDMFFVGVKPEGLTVLNITDPYHPRVLCDDCVDLWSNPCSGRRFQ